MNLIWIMTDQQPCGTLASYGNERIQTPNLDRIAKEGVRCTRSYIAAFPCSPSRGSIMTGRYAHRHGVTTNDVALPDDVPTLGEACRAAGYATAHIGKWHIGGNMYRGRDDHKPRRGVWRNEVTKGPERFEYEPVPGGGGEDAPQHGFDHWVGGWEHYRDWLRTEGLGDLVDSTGIGGHNDLPSGPDDTHAVAGVGESHHVETFIANEAVAYIEQQRDSTAPFAMVVSFYGPHLPVAPPAPWVDRYEVDETPLPATWDDTLEGKPRGQRANEWHVRPKWSERQLRDYVARYWGYCSYIDAQIGRVLDALDTTGQTDDTLVLFTSDHGDMITAHGFVYKLLACGYDELMRVPLLVKCPGRLVGGGECGALISSVDILPTVLDLLGIDAPPGLDGLSFVPILDSPAAAHRAYTVTSGCERTFTVTRDRWKYVLNLDPRDLDELYDRKGDPHERHNCAYDPEYGEAIEVLRGHFREWLLETDHPYATALERAMTQPPPTDLDAIVQW
jgi:arylsulfatase